MAQIFDLPEEAIKRLRALIPDEGFKTAADEALSKPSRECKGQPAAVHRLIISDDQRQGVVARLRLMLAREGFEECGSMLPIGHIYEGLIQTFSSESRLVV